MTTTTFRPTVDRVLTFVTGQLHELVTSRVTIPSQTETFRIGSADDEAFDALLIEEGIRRNAARSPLDFETVDDFLRSLGD